MRVRLSWVCAVILATCAAAPGAVRAEVRQPAAPAVDAPDAVAEAITAIFPGATITREPRSDDQARKVVAEHVDPAILRGSTGVSGTETRFTLADGIARHVGVIVVRYDSKAAADSYAPTGARGFPTLLRNTKILTPVVITRAGPTLAIFFSESSGEPKMRELLNAAANRYRTGGSR